MSCPNGTSVEDELFQTTLCVPDGLQQETFLAFSVILGFFSGILVFYTLDAIVRKKFIAGLIVFFATGAEIALFMTNLGFYLGWTKQATNPTLGVFAGFAMACMMTVAEKWGVGVMKNFHSYSIEAIRYFRITVIVFRLCWWIPMAILWILSITYGYSLGDYPETYNRLAGGGLLCVGLVGSLFACCIISFTSWKMYKAIKKAADGANILKSNVNYVDIKRRVIVYSILQLVVNVSGGLICLIIGIIAIAINNVRGFFYIYMYAINPLAAVIPLPVVYFYRRAAEHKTNTDSQLSSIFHALCGCGTPVETENSITNPESKPMETPVAENAGPSILLQTLANEV